MFEYKGDINANNENVLVQRKKGSQYKKIMMIGTGTLNASKCGMKATPPNTNQRKKQCCSVSEQSTFGQNHFNQNIRADNGKVVFRMKLNDNVSKNQCEKNKGRITMTFTPKTQAPTSTVSLFMFS